MKIILRHGNRELLEKFATLGAEIDALLDMSFNRDYDKEIKEMRDI